MIAWQRILDISSLPVFGRPLTGWPHVRHGGRDGSATNAGGGVAIYGVGRHDVCSNRMIEMEGKMTDEEREGARERNVKGDFIHPWNFSDNRKLILEMVVGTTTTTLENF